MEHYTRKSIFDNLNTYDYLCNDPNAFIEITQWANGDGYDINISSNHKQLYISLTDGEIEAINHLINCLQYGNFTKASDKK